MVSIMEKVQHKVADFKERRDQKYFAVRHMKKKAHAQYLRDLEHAEMAVQQKKAEADVQPWLTKVATAIDKNRKRRDGLQPTKTIVVKQQGGSRQNFWDPTVSNKNKAFEIDKGDYDPFEVKKVI